MSSMHGVSCHITDSGNILFSCTLDLTLSDSSVFCLNGKEEGSYIARQQQGRSTESQNGRITVTVIKRLQGPVPLMPLGV